MSNERIPSNGLPVNQQGLEMNIPDEMVKSESSLTKIISYFDTILLEGWCYYATEAELIFKHINMLTRKEDICFSIDNNFSVKVSFSQRPEMSVNNTLTSIYDIKSYMKSLETTILCEGTGIYYKSYAPKCTGKVSSKRSRQFSRCTWCRTLRKRLLIRKFSDVTKITIQKAREAVEKYKKRYKRLVLKKRILDQELISTKENAQRSEELMRSILSELPDTKKLSIMAYLNGSKLENHSTSHNYLLEYFREQDLSKLANLHQNEYGHVYKEEIVDNFIDCGSDVVIKDEINMDLSSDVIENNMSPTEKTLNKPILEIKPLTLKSVAISVLKSRKDGDTDKKYYTIIQLSDEEMYERIEKLKNEENFLNAPYKCESCVLVFKDDKELATHNADLHLQKPRHMQCTICSKFILYWRLNPHEAAHRRLYACAACGAAAGAGGMLEHLRGHAVPFNDLIDLRKTVMLLNPSLKSKKRRMDGKKEYGYKCSECNKCFEKQYLRYKHVLKCHREGFKCETCGKTFAYKNTLNKHTQVHELLLPREECPICNKLVRSDRVNAHAKIHSDRQQFYCNTCDKTFVSMDSYEKHLKNSKTHALHDVLKYKCTLCSKGFRTMTSLKDHINYYHMGRTDYKCPICNKALSTSRGVTRHVRRTHQGLKEKIGDKILCQICGKTFRDKKCLHEHELIHTGEKPLSCDICSRTFRQSACLYTHRRRVHNMPARRIVHTGDDVHPSDGQDGQSH